MTKFNPVTANEAAGGRYLQKVGAVKYEICRWVDTPGARIMRPVEGEPLVPNEAEAKARVAILGADFCYWPVVNRQ